MASSDVVTLKDSTFEQEVLKSETPVLVDFWAVWCGPCKAIAPLVDDSAARYKGKLKVGKMDVDNEQMVAQQFGIRSIPTLLIFKGGRVVDTVIGSDASSRMKLEEGIKKVVG
ncbi:MAG: thioredoxin [Anaeromyxobacter sp.]